MCPGLKSICAAYYETLDINICNNYIDQFTEAMCSKKIKVCMDFVYDIWEKRSQLLSTSM